MDIWFSLIGGAIGKMLIPGALLIGSYVWLCKRWGRPVNGRIVYYIISVLFLVGIFASLGELWGSSAMTGRR